MEEEKREHESKMKKMEAEMEQVFEMKVKEKKQKLKDSELELTRRHEERKKASDGKSFHKYLISNFFFNFFRRLNFKFENWKSVRRLSIKRKWNGKPQMASH